eukprot:1424320-Amphidinium_carterae.1
MSKTTSNWNHFGYPKSPESSGTLVLGEFPLRHYALVGHAPKFVKRTLVAMFTTAPVDHLVVVQAGHVNIIEIT